MPQPLIPLTNRILFWWALWIFWKTPGQRWLLVALIALVGTAGICGSQNYKRRLAIINEAESVSNWNRILQRTAFDSEPDLTEILGKTLSQEEQRRARLQQMIAPLPTSLAYSSGNFLAVLPPSPMMILSTGVSDLWPDRFSITAHSQLKNLQREEIANPYQLESGTWDATTVVVYLLPLVIIAFTYNFLSSDREQGVLSLILSNPIDCCRWVVVGLVARTAIATGVIIPVAVLPVTFAIGSEEFFNVLFAAGLWSLCVIVYSLFWMSTALLVNSVGGSSHQNGVFLLLLWLFMICVIPGTFSRFATSREAVTTHHELITQERAFREAAEKNGMALKEAYYQQHPEVTRPSREEDRYNQTRWDVIRLEVDRQLRPLLRESLLQMQKRFHYSELGMFFSPALASKLAQDHLCGTSLPHHLLFVKQASEYDEEFKAFFQPKMMSRNKLTLEDYEAIPEFRYRDLAGHHHSGLLVGAFLSMLSWTSVAFVIGYRRIQARFAGV